MDDRNQRRHPRIRTTIPARVETDGVSLSGTIENLGPGGAFFATDTLEVSVDVGTAVIVAFRSPESGEDRRVRGTVIRFERYFHEGGLYRALAIRFEAGLAE